MLKKCVLFLLYLGLTLTASAFIQTFDLTQFPPRGWTRYNFSSPPDDEWVRYTSYYLDPPACARINYDTPNNDWLITPRCSVAMDDSLIFYYRNFTQSLVYRESLFIRISTTDRDTSNFAHFNLVSPPLNNISWWRAAFSLNAYVDQKIYIGFHYRMNYKYGMLIDSIIGPTEVPVYDAAIERATIYGPYIVGSPKTATAVAKNVGYLTPAVSFPVTMTVLDPVPPYWINTQSITDLLIDSTQTVTFVPWTPDTIGIHTFKVYCSLDFDSNAVNDTISRLIEVAPPFYTAPYSQNFNSRLWNIFGETPCGWTIFANGSSDTNTLHWNTNDWYRYTFIGGDSVASVEAATEDTSLEGLMSPRIDCSSPGTYFLKFWMYYYQSNMLLPDSGMVLISNDDGATWNEIAKYRNATQSAGNRTFDVSTYVSGQSNVKVMFRYHSVHDGYWRIDNFFLGTLGVPSLIAPANDSLINDRTPTFQWSNVGAAEKYQIQVSDNNSFTPTVIDTEVTPNVFTPVIGITPDDTFYWRVRAGIGVLYAGWSTPYRFFLDATPPPLCTLYSPRNGETLMVSTPSFFWSLIEEASQYQIQIAGDPLFTLPQIDTIINDAVYTSSSLAWGTHYWRVLAIDAAQNKSPWTAAWMFYIGTGAPSNWQTMAEIPSEAGSGKPPKSGSTITTLNGKLYFINATNTKDFYCYTPDSGIGSWAMLESMPLGVKADGDGKKPKKGAAIAAWDDNVYVLRGNNTLGFWKYVTDTTPGQNETLGWHKLANITEGAKKSREGSGMIHISLGPQDGIFTMKGSKTNEFYLYEIVTNSWIPVTGPPLGQSGKIGYKKGSCLTYDGDTFVYVLKGTYGDFFRYNLNSGTWQELKRYDPKLSPSREGKKKKPKDGANITYFRSNVYMLKGGNTYEFWKYDIASDSWLQMPQNWDIPTGGGKKVKGGGTLCVLDDYFYVSKGAGTNEFYRHDPPTDLIAKTIYSNTQQGKMSKDVSTTGFKLTISPNPAINQTTVRYYLPKIQPINIKFYNVNGSLIKSYANSNPGKDGIFIINTKTLPSGVYILRFTSADIKFVRKLVLEK